MPSQEKKKITYDSPKLVVEDAGFNFSIEGNNSTDEKASTQADKAPDTDSSQSSNDDDDSEDESSLASSSDSDDDAEKSIPALDNKKASDSSTNPSDGKPAVGLEVSD